MGETIAGYLYIISFLLIVFIAVFVRFSKRRLFFLKFIISIVLIALAILAIALIFDKYIK